MRNPRLGLVMLVGAAAVFVACSDDETGPREVGSAGAGGAMAGSSGAGAGNGGAGGNVAGGGAGGSMAGSAGAGGSAGAAGNAGAAGTGGAPLVIAPTVYLIDNVRLRPRADGGEGDGSGGAGFGGEAGGGGEGGGTEAGGAAGVGGAADGAAGASGGEAGAGSGPSRPDFVETFDTTLGMLSLNPDGFSPGPGQSGGPVILPNTTLVWEANVGNPGGAAKLSVPFSVPTQQADVARGFGGPQDLTGYELLADVKVIEFGDAGDCASAWMYVWGAGYANDQSAEPARGQAQKLTKDEWTTIRLNLDGPYGYHSEQFHPAFVPTVVTSWGIHVNTWGCPP